MLQVFFFLNCNLTIPGCYYYLFFLNSYYILRDRCSNSMNHEKDAIPHASSNNCVYQHQYENRIYLCKVTSIHNIVLSIVSKSSLIQKEKYSLKKCHCNIIFLCRFVLKGEKRLWCLLRSWNRMNLHGLA